MAKLKEIRQKPLKELTGKELGIRFARKIVKMAKFYQKYLSNKKLTYYYLDENLQERTFVLHFYPRNFRHLCGVAGYKRTRQLQARDFYEDAVKDNLKEDGIQILGKGKFILKMESIGQLKNLIHPEKLGIVDGAVVFNGVNYGEMIRTKQDLMALGTVIDQRTHNRVPLSQLNIRQDKAMRKVTGTFYKVLRMTIEPI